MRRAAPKAGGKNKPYARPEAFTPGEILTDTSHKKWKLGKPIGSGGFGDIYLASDDINKPVNDKTGQYVVKIEPHANGPLFVEIAFYLRVAKPEMIQEWKGQRKMEALGMPSYISSGSHDYKSQKYRFLVLQRFGQDLHKIVSTKPGKRLSLRSIQAVALQIIDILEYIHSRDFVHGDIKASNLLLGLGGKKQQLYLLDYGLAGKFVDPQGQHLKYGPDARKAHNGTLEYTSRDAHIGAFSRRGDLEILGYNMLEWLCGNLPWPNTDTPDHVSKQKIHFMGNIQLKKLYPSDIPGLDVVEKYLKYVAGLEFDENPNYNHLRDLLRRGLPSKLTTLYLEDSIGASPKKKPGKRPSAAAATLTEDESFEEEEPLATPPKKIKLPDDTNKKRNTRTTKRVQKNFNWTRVLSSNPEKIIHLASQANGAAAAASTPDGGKKSSPPIPGTLTPAMLQILSKRKENNPLSTAPRGIVRTEFVEGTTKLTPAMKEILLKTKKKKLRKSMGEDLGGLMIAKKIKQKAVATAAAARATTAPVTQFPSSSTSTSLTTNVYQAPMKSKSAKSTTAAEIIVTAVVSSRSARQLRRNT